MLPTYLSEFITRTEHHTIVSYHFLTVSLRNVSCNVSTVYLPSYQYYWLTWLSLAKLGFEEKKSTTAKVDVQTNLPNPDPDYHETSVSGRILEGMFFFTIFVLAYAEIRTFVFVQQLGVPNEQFICKNTSQIRNSQHDWNPQRKPINQGNGKQFLNLLNPVARISKSNFHATSDFYNWSS